MAYQRLILLAPCHGLEDFPLYHTGEDAASLLACWTALWHPSLLHAAGNIPAIERCDYPPENIENSLLVLPRPCESELDADLPHAAQKKNATLIRGAVKRRDVLQQALQPLVDGPTVDKELVKDFLAFGFAYLQVELLTQQMRYSSSLDQSRIAKAAVSAAQAAVENNHETCRDHLTNCFDALADERNHYYPVDVYLIDLTLLAPATLGGALTKQLADSIPQNVLASGTTMQQLADEHAATLDALRAALADRRLGLAGGDWAELPLPLMTQDAAVRQLLRGRECFQRHLGQPPTTYGRRRAGLYSMLAQAVRHAGYRSALHLTFDEGRCPEASQCKTQWQLEGQEPLDALARAPLDASKHETFLNLPSQLGDTMDTDHVATRIFVHWPGRVAPWYLDLRRAARFGNALGRFVTLADYFQETGASGHHGSFASDDYRYPYLKQTAARNEQDPLSRWVRYWRRTANLIAARGLYPLRHGFSAAEEVNDDADRLANLEHQVDQLVQPQAEALADDDIDAGIDQFNSSQFQAIEAALANRAGNTLTLVNALSFPRRVLVDTSSFPGAAQGESVYATHREPDDRQWTLVDVPAMGFASISSANHDPKPLTGPLLADELTLRNEFFQAQIDPDTGALRSLKDYRARGTRLSQQLALRIAPPKTGQYWVDRKTPAAYSVMAADQVEVTRNGKIRAEITARGRLLDEDGNELGRFVQQYQLDRGSRVLQLQVSLTPTANLMDDPWDSYYCCRFAWSDETAVLRAGNRLQQHETSKKRLDAPLFVDIDSGDQHTTVVTGGLPYHRRVGDRRLDTLLLVEGESARTFRLGIGVDLPLMTRGSLDFLAAPPNVLTGAGPAASGWLFHIDARNVLATWWQPLADPNEGLRVRLLETEGRRAIGHLRAYRAIQNAELVDAGNEPEGTLKVEQGVVEFELGPHQFRELRVRW